MAQRVIYSEKIFADSEKKGRIIAFFHLTSLSLSVLGDRERKGSRYIR